MIYCACEEAKTKCEETCPRWPGETKPDRCYRVPWLRKKKGVAVYVVPKEDMKREEW